MKNIVENQGIKTDKPLAMSYEALKAERDALERQLSMSEAKCKGYFSDAAAALVKCDALAVENAALKSKAAELVHEASEVYSAYNATIKEPDGDFMDMQTLYEMQCIETPATDAALAAIREAQPVGYIDPDSLKEYRGQRAGGTWSAVPRTTSGLNMTTPIYTAPPAPAAPEGGNG
ncbi:hypothetical protein PTR73_09905 [Serratia nevei]|uniref:hypothetical protein n=1 Tax=Serratia nevei TaxID=2703794 RepID=UPI00313C589E